MDPGSFIFLLIVGGVFVTSILSGVLGMAGGMILMGILVWVLPVQQAMILHAISQLVANGSRAFIHRKHIYRKSLPYYFMGLVVMLAVFSCLSIVPDKLFIFLLMGLTPFAAFLLPKSLQLNFMKPRQAFLCGLITTTFQLTGGLSGPLLDVFFQTRALTRHETVATKAFTQSISHVTKLIYFSLIISRFPVATKGMSSWLCVSIIIAALVGSHLSKFILDRLSDKHFYRVTQGVLLAIGTFYLLKAAALWLHA